MAPVTSLTAAGLSARTSSKPGCSRDALAIISFVLTVARYRVRVSVSDATKTTSIHPGAVKAAGGALNSTKLPG